MPDVTRRASRTTTRQTAHHRPHHCRRLLSLLITVQCSNSHHCRRHHRNKINAATTHPQDLTIIIRLSGTRIPCRNRIHTHARVRLPALKVQQATTLMLQQLPPVLHLNICLLWMLASPMLLALRGTYPVHLSALPIYDLALTRACRIAHRARFKTIQISNRDQAAISRRGLCMLATGASGRPKAMEPVN